MVGGSGGGRFYRLQSLVSEHSILFDGGEGDLATNNPGSNTLSLDNLSLLEFSLIP